MSLQTLLAEPGEYFTRTDETRVGLDFVTIQKFETEFIIFNFNQSV